MRQVLILTLVAICDLAFAQSQLGSLNRNPDIYIFNNFKDTIYLTKVDLGQFSFTDSIKIADTIQIDGSGSKEIIFVRYSHGSTDAHGGSFDINDYRVFTNYEIWNPDTKTLLFEAIIDYKNDFNNSYAYDEQWGSYRKGQGRATYKYDITVNKNGHVSISNLKNDGCTPDHTEGTYKFLDGKYTLE